MSIKKLFLSVFKTPLILDFVLSKVVEGTKKVAVNEIDRKLSDIKDFLFEKKNRCELSTNGMDEEVFKLCISGLRKFAQGLSLILDEIDA